MKHFLFILCALCCMTSCKNGAKREMVTSDTKTNETEAIEKINYPKTLDSVFDAHGGVSLWKQYRTMTFTIPKDENPETHITDLYSRKDRIVTPNYNMGFDGQRPWLLNKEQAYAGNVEFYHNLMFYFYAMPFVLADDGIHYKEAEPLQYDGISYPGIQITYGEGIGASPKDEYYLHYHPETYQMTWLGYTVTYRTGEDSDNIKWIRYDDWGNFNGLILPNSISWYDYEGMNIKALRNTVKFEQVALAKNKKPEGFYDKPDRAQYYVKPE